jgi:hypothetical protein
MESCLPLVIGRNCPLNSQWYAVCYSLSDYWSVISAFEWVFGLIIDFFERLFGGNVVAVLQPAFAGHNQ